MLQNAKQRGIPSSGYLLPVVQPAAVGHKRTWQRSHYELQLNNTGLILSTWEGSLAEQKAFSSWWYRWEQSTEAPGSARMLTQLLVKGVNSRGLFFVIQGHRELLIFIQLLVSLRTKVTFHWFFSLQWHRREAAQVSPGSTVLAIAVSSLQGYSRCNYTVLCDEWPRFVFQP